MAVVVIVDSRGKAVDEAGCPTSRVGQAAGQTRRAVGAAAVVIVIAAASMMRTVDRAGTGRVGLVCRLGRDGWRQRQRRRWRHRGGWRVGRVRDRDDTVSLLFGPRIPRLVRHQVVARRVVDYSVWAARWDRVVHTVFAVAGTPGRGAHAGKVRLVGIRVQARRPKRLTHTTKVTIATTRARAGAVATRWRRRRWWWLRRRHGRPGGQGTGNHWVVIELVAEAAEATQSAHSTHTAETAHTAQC